VEKWKGGISAIHRAKSQLPNTRRALCLSAPLRGKVEGWKGGKVEKWNHCYPPCEVTITQSPNHPILQSPNPPITQSSNHPIPHPSATPHLRVRQTQSPCSTRKYSENYRERQEKSRRTKTRFLSGSSTFSMNHLRRAWIAARFGWRSATTTIPACEGCSNGIV